MLEKDSARERNLVGRVFMFSIFSRSANHEHVFMSTDRLSRVAQHLIDYVGAQFNVGVLTALRHRQDIAGYLDD
jgi:hypothetical protein